jgi:hypothetical protein
MRARLQTGFNTRNFQQEILPGTFDGVAQNAAPPPITW